MSSKILINHAIPGRLRLTVPSLERTKHHAFVKEAFHAISGIKGVRIVKEICSIVIEYDKTLLSQSQVLQFAIMFFNPTKKVSQISRDQLNRELRNSLLRSALSGSLLLASFLRHRAGLAGPSLDYLDYLAVASTAYATLSHGENNLNHPDVLTMILSTLSLGPTNILRAAAITWGFNLIEIINDVRRHPYPLQPTY